MPPSVPLPERYFKINLLKLADCGTVKREEVTSASDVTLLHLGCNAHSQPGLLVYFSKLWLLDGCAERATWPAP